MICHQLTQWRTDPSGVAYRSRRTFPAGPPDATVLLAGPGNVSALDGDGPVQRLLDRLRRRLLTGGAQVLECDMPARDAGQPSDDADQRARADRLDQVLRAHRHLVPKPTVLVGFSLGAQAMLRLLESGRLPQVERLVLVGTVLEEERFLSARVDSLDLVYGALDLVGYLTEDDPAGSLPPVTCGPDLYGEWTAAHLIGQHPLHPRIHLFPGLGHTLHPCVTGSVVDPVPELATLAGLGTSGGRRPRPTRREASARDG